MCGRGELVVWIVKLKGMCKSQTAGSPKSPGPANIQAKKKRIGNIMIIVLNEFLVMEDSVSTC